MSTSMQDATKILIEVSRKAWLPTITEGSNSEKPIVSRNGLQPEVHQSKQPVSENACATPFCYRNGKYRP